MNKKLRCYCHDENFTGCNCCGDSIYLESDYEYCDENECYYCGSECHNNQCDNCFNNNDDEGYVPEINLEFKI